MKINYSMEGGGPSMWGIVALQSNATATLKNTVLNLTMEGAPTSLTSVFLGGMQTGPYGVTTFLKGFENFNNVFNLENVQVNFVDKAAVTAGKNVSLFYIDSSATTAVITGGSKLVAPTLGNDDWLDRSLIYIDQTLDAPPVIPTEIAQGGSAPPSIAIPDTTSLDLHATNSTLGGGAYVAAATKGNTSLSMLLDGTTTWAGDVTVEAGVGGKTTKADITLDGTASWTGKVASLNGNASVAVKGSGVCKATGNIAAASFLNGSISLDGGTIQAQTASLAISAAIALGANGGIIDTNDNAAGSTGIISGTGALTKNGNGTLTLSATNSYEGGTILNSGVVSVAADVALGKSGTDLTFNGGALQVTGTAYTSTDRAATLNAGGGTFEIVDVANNFTLSNNVSGVGGLTKIGAGILTLSGSASDYSGDTTISAGKLVITGNKTGTGKATISTGATLQIGTGGAGGSFVGDIANSGILSVNRTGAVTLAGEISGAGVLTMDGGGTLTLSHDNSTYSGDITVTGNSTLAVNSNSNLGAEGAQAQKGSLTLNSGTLKIGADGFNTDRLIHLTSTGTFDTNGHDATFTTVIDGAGKLVKTGGGLMVLTAANIYSGGTQITAGTLKIGGANGSVTGDVTVDTGAVLELARTNTATFANKISGKGSVVKTGTATATLSGLNDYEGGTEIAGGILAIHNDGNLGKGGALTFNNGTLQLLDTGFDIARAVHMNAAGTVDTNGNDGTISGKLDGAGAFTKTGAGTLTLSGANGGYSGAVGITGGILAIHNNDNLGTGAALTFNGGTLQFLDTDIDIARAVHMDGAGSIDTNGKDGSLSGVLDGTGAFTKAGAGTLTLSHDNSGFSGAITITGGVLSVSADNNLGTGDLTLKDASTLQLTGDVTTTRKVTLDAGTGTIETGANKTSTFTGGVTGAGKLSVSGSGTMVLTGTNDYSGSTTIASGSTLQIGNATADGSIAGTVANAGMLVFNNAAQTTFGSVISGAGELHQKGAGTLILTGENTYTGKTSIDTGSTLQIGDGGNSGSISGDVSNSGTFAFKRSGTLDFAGVISGNGTLEQNGTGSVTLTGDSSVFAGTTHVSLGELVVDGTLGGTMTVDANAKLSGSGSIGGNVRVNGDLAGASGQGLTFNSGLILGALSTVTVSFDQTNDEGGVFNVKGVLKLGGTVNVSSFGTGGPGLYHLFHAKDGYTGTITKGTMPNGVDTLKIHIDTLDPYDVYIANSNGATLTYWNGTQTAEQGDGTLHGGAGTWTVDNNGFNWTNTPDYDINGAWTDGQYAVFSGTAGIVTVDTTAGAVTATGMQFMIDGYSLTGGNLKLVTTGNGAKPSIKVGASNQPSNLTTTISTVLDGVDGLTKDMGGKLILTGANTYTGGTDITGGTLQLGDGTTNGSIVGTINTGTSAVIKGVLAINAANAVTVANQITGTGNVSTLGTGEITLSGSNSYSGGTTITGGAVIITQDNNLGASQSTVALDGGTLRFSADFGDTTAFTHAIKLENAASTLDTDTYNIVVTGAMSGAQALKKTGTGTLILAANNTYSGDITIADGTLQIGNHGTSGAIAGNVINNGILSFDRTDTGGYAFTGVISGTGHVEQNGTTTLTLTNTNNSYKGGTVVKNGILAANSNQALGDFTGALTLDGGIFQNTAAFSTNTRAIVIGNGGGTFQTDDDLTIAGALTGAGAWTKTGTGDLIFSGDEGDFAGAGIAQNGRVQVDGILGGSLTVNQGAILGGKGTIKGDTVVGDGAVLTGLDGKTLTFGSKLTLGNGSQINVTLGTPTAQALFTVNGDLDLGSSHLNVTEDVGGFGVGVYRIFNYGGELSGSMTVGSVPNGLDAAEMWVQTAYNNQVNLVNQNGAEVTFWNAEGDRSLNNHTNTIIGGSGTWDVANDNWTEDNSPTSPQKDRLFNARWNNGKYAVFGGKAGTVTIDNQNGSVIATGLQFAADGYILTGDALSLDTGAPGTPPIIRVGNGDENANMTATISAELTGTNGLKKADYGTLILTGENSYTGGTTIAGGVLQIGDGYATGSIQGTVTIASSSYGDGTLAFNRQDNIAFTGNISGDGKGGVIQKGDGAVTLSGNNTFSGGLTVEKGSVKAGVADHAFGSGVLKVKTDATADLDNFDTTIGGLAAYDASGVTGDGEVKLGSATLTLEQNTDSQFSGIISGSGNLTKNGSAVLTLSGANTYTGATSINKGTLKQGAEGVFNTASSGYAIGADGTLDLAGFNTTLSALSNSGLLNLGSMSGTTLTVAGNYIGSGGTIVINTVLGDDTSKTDMLKVQGDTSGNTNVKLVNRDGLGAQTTNGIKIVEVGGQSKGTFSLLSDYTTKDGQRAVVGGAYAYTLQQGGTNSPKDGHWYLSSHANVSKPNPDPEKPRYSAGIPLYEGYAQNMQVLNKLPTLQQRVGSRYWTGENGNGADKGAVIDARGIWARIEGAHNHFEPQTSSGMKQDVNTYMMQTGIDGQFYENEYGSLLAGLTGQYGHARGDVAAFDGDGQINTSAWSLGATATWYGRNGFYVDNQAQVSWFDNDLYSQTARTGLATGRKATGYALSIEAGQRITLNENWTLTPQAQLMWSKLNADAFTDAWGSGISLQNNDSLNARLGTAINYDRQWIGKDGQQVNSSLYALANVYQQFLDNAKINVAGVPFNTDGNKLWAGIGAGGTYSWAANKYTVYGEGSVNTSLKDFAQNYTVKGTAGFKIRW